MLRGHALSFGAVGFPWHDQLVCAWLTTAGVAAEDSISGMMWPSFFLTKIVFSGRPGTPDSVGRDDSRQSAGFGAGSRPMRWFVPEGRAQSKADLGGQ